jgi:hypothetical protein
MIPDSRARQPCDGPMQCGNQPVDVSFLSGSYGCAGYRQGGPAACADSARTKRVRVEELLLKGSMAEILSDEAVALAQDDIRAELRRDSGKPMRASTPLPPGCCGNGHELTPDNVVPAERVPAGAAASAGPIVPLPGVTNGRPRLSVQATCGGVPPPAQGSRNGEGAPGTDHRRRTGLCFLSRNPKRSVPKGCFRRPETAH